MSAPPPPGLPRGPLKVLLGLASTALVLLAVELAVRTWADPPQRTQVLRPSREIRMETLDGVPTWSSPAHSATRWRLECAAERPQADAVVAFGSSILAAVSVEPEQAWSALLQAALDAAPPGPGPAPCVHNLAETAFGHEQKVAVARHRLPTLRPRLLIWEVWGTDTARYVQVGDNAIRLGDLAVDDSGLPNPLDLPAPLNRWLLARSATWLRVVIGLSPEVRPSPGQLEPAWIYGEDLPALHAGLAPQGVELLLVAAPPLHQPFAASAAEWSELERQAAAFAARTPGVHMLRLAEELVEEDHEALRLDPCCHYNEAGNRAVARVLEEAIRPLLAAPPQQPGG